MGFLYGPFMKKHQYKELFCLLFSSIGWVQTDVLNLGRWFKSHCFDSVEMPLLTLPLREIRSW